MKSKKIALFIIESSVLTHIFEGKNKNKSKDLIDIISKMKEHGIPYKAVTTMVSVLRSIWKADSKSSIKNIQKVIEVVDIFNTQETDYKNEEKVRNDIIDFANRFSKVADKIAKDIK